jgi:ABC-type transport system substrate-binding protein
MVLVAVAGLGIHRGSMADQPTSRRDFLRATLRLAGSAGAYTAAARFGMVGGGLATLAGCQTQRSPQELVSKLVFAIISDVKSFDPAFIIMALDGYISPNIHEPLTWYSKSVELIPRLALSWEPSDGARRWTFKLRPGVTFHDGTPFDATAVKMHFDRIKNPLTKSERISRVAPMKAVEIIDPMTVEFELHNPFSVWPEQVRSSWAGITSPTRLKEIKTPREYGLKPVGTGPFRFVEYVPEEYIRFERNPDYWDKGAILFESLEFRPVKEATTRLILVEQGQVDIAPVGFAHVDLASKSDKMSMARQAHLATSYIGLNCMRAPLNNPAVRKAINKAVDREKIVRLALRGAGFPAVGPIPKVVRGKNPAVVGYAYDPEAATRELKEAGVKPGTKLILWSTDRSEERLQCELIKEMLQKVGLEIEPRIFEAQAFWGQFDRYQKRDGQGNPDWRANDPGVFDMFIGGWVGGESQWGFLDPLFRSTSTSNNAFYKNEQVDALLKSALATPTPEERTPIFQRIEEIVVEDAPWLFMYDREITLITRPGIENFKPHPSGEYEFQGIRLTPGVTGA